MAQFRASLRTLAFVSASLGSVPACGGDSGAPDGMNPGGRHTGGDEGAVSGERGTGGGNSGAGSIPEGGGNADGESTGGESTQGEGGGEGGGEGEGDVFDDAGDACSVTSGGAPVSPALAGLVNDVRGFAQGTVGGAHGCVYHVTSLGDSGPGTLRAGLESERPLWIVFDVNGRIDLNSLVIARSNKTVDGRGAEIDIRGHGLLFEGESVSNVIVENVTFGGGESDAIVVYRGSHSVWIDHCSFGTWSEGQVDVTEAATNVTVSWSHFYDHEIGMLLGGRPDATEDAAIRVTMHHNYFERVNERAPQARFGKVHVANNLFVDWAGYAIGASQLSEVAADNNIFVAGREQSAIRDIVGTDPDHGSIRTSGHWLLGGATVVQRDPGSVFSPGAFYELELDEANAALRTQLETNAGAL